MVGFTCRQKYLCFSVWLCLIWRVSLSCIVSYLGSSAEQPQLIITLFKEAMENSIFWTAEQFLYMNAQTCVTGRTDRKPELMGKDVVLYNSQWKFPKGQLLFQLVTHLVFISFVLELCLCQSIIENIQWVEVLRKPPQQGWCLSPFLAPQNTLC